MGTRSLLQEAAAGLAHGADDADAYYQDTWTERLSRQGGRLEGVTGGREIGVGLRQVRGEATSFGYTNRVDADGLAQLARRVSDRGGEVATSLPAADAHRHDVPVAIDPAGVSLEEKAGLLARIEAWARAVDPRISEVQTSLSSQRTQVRIVQSSGTFVEDHRAQVALTVRCIAGGGSLLQTGYNVLGGAQGLELLEEGRVQDLAEKTAAQAIRMLTAKPAPAGPMTVVLSSQAGGTMVHEAIGHGLEADLVQKELSVYHGRVGTCVAAADITVVDDATLAGRRGFLNVDDEGTPGQRTVLVENGILKGFMYDRLSARRDQVPSTGNGRRESYQHRPIVRMTNTLIAPGPVEPEAIIEDTAAGLLVTKMGGGQVDTTTGNFVFQVSESFLIEKGKVGAPVRGATLIGNGPKVLEQIDRVGNDLGFDLGTCGKDGQGVPVADAQPTLRIPSITVGGERA